MYVYIYIDVCVCVFVYDGPILVVNYMVAKLMPLKG